MDETFKVAGSLTRLDGYRTGAFSFALTHWRRNIFGSCFSYFATTAGTLTLLQ